ncbi:MAG: uroporphyrinogen-III C-methyltransferase [Planctomycetes bacterium]|nr:uroporphyrinogen-III C-methyltransferase [Planctomycetota bacterium]
MTIGTVYLIGAGPGDPGLITVRGMECLRKADVVVYDYLSNPALLREAPEAEHIYVGKRGSTHVLEQPDINDLLVAKAKEGKAIARLKGGDPFVFGRGGEEALHLKEHGIPFEVVPGVTAGVAAAAYAGIPVTHRGCTSSLGMLTGHEDPTKPESALDWARIAGSMGTLVFYMGVKNLPKVVDKLIEHGRPKDTPVALIQWGTMARQRTVVGTLGDIVEKTKGIEPPAITIVGEVVALREHLNWFETRPLFGKRVVVTRSREQASDLSAMLQGLGAEVMELPTIKLVPPDDFAPMDKAIEDIASFDWIIFASVNGVKSFFDRAMEIGKDIRDLAGPRICAIGPGTRAAAEAYHVRVDCQPPKYVAESVVDEFRKMEDMAGKSILIPRTDVGRRLLMEELEKMGAAITEVTAYRTLPETISPEALQDLLDNPPDFVTFTSSSTVRNFVECVGKKSLSQIAAGTRFISIGPITSKTAQELGICITAEAEESTIPALVAAVVRDASGKKP